MDLRITHDSLAEHDLRSSEYISPQKPAGEVAMGVNQTMYTIMQDGIPTNRPSRESVLKRLSDALLRRSLTKVRLVFLYSVDLKEDV